MIRALFRRRTLVTGIFLACHIEEAARLALKLDGWWSQ
jgi:hypothetical protein